MNNQSVGGFFPEHWIDGRNPVEPPIKVQRFAEGTWVLRESPLANWETRFQNLRSSE